MVATLLQDDEAPPRRGHPPPHLVVAGCGEREVAQRVQRERVEAQRDDDEPRLDLGERLECLVEGLDVRPVVHAGRERQVPVLALPGALADLVGPTEEIRVLAVRVRVDRDVAHVVPTPEELLRAVAVMKVHIEDPDPLAGGPSKGVGRDRGVVEEAVAGVQGTCGVMPRRPAQPVDGGLTPEHEIGRGEGHIHGPARGGVGPCDERRRAVEAIPSRTARDRGRHLDRPNRLRTHALEHRRVWPRVRRHRPALALLPDELAPGLFEEVDETSVVDREDGLVAVLGRGDALERWVSLEGRADVLRPLDDLERGHLRAEHRLVRHVVPEMRIAVDELHASLVSRGGRS